MTNLDRLRKEVDRIDETIINRLLERADITRKIGEEKSRTGVSLHDPEREAEVIARLRAINRGRLRDDLLEAVYRRIIEMCIEVQREEQA